MTALRIIKTIGISGLARFSGCRCGNFTVGGVTVELSCRKGGGSGELSCQFVRVYPSTDDATGDELRSVAEEVARQCEPYDGGELRVRYCRFEQDRDLTCSYCSNPRTDAAAYLCDYCQANNDVWGDPIATRYDYRRHEFILVDADYDH